MRHSIPPTIVAHRPLFVFAGLLVLFALGTAPIGARYDWCSRDPVLSFSRGLLTDHILDVQLAVNNGSDLLTNTAATLNVTVPSNVLGQDLSAPVTEPVFQIYTSFNPTLDRAASRSYTILIDAFIPATDGDFDTKLIITGLPLDGLRLGTLNVACSGRTGTTTHAKVSLAPFTVACMQGTEGVVAFESG